MMRKPVFLLVAVVVLAIFAGSAKAATIVDTAGGLSYSSYWIAYELYDNTLGINADNVPVFINNEAPINSTESKNLRVMNGKVNLSGQRVFLLADSSNLSTTPVCDVTPTPFTPYIIGESLAGAVPSADISINIYDGRTFCTRNGLDTVPGSGAGSLTVQAGTFVSAGMGNAGTTTGNVVLRDALNFFVDPNLNPSCATHPVVQLAYISQNEASSFTTILTIIPQFTGAARATGLDAEIDTVGGAQGFFPGSGPYVTNFNEILGQVFTISNLQASEPPRWKAFVTQTITGSISVRLTSVNPEEGVTIFMSDTTETSQCTSNLANTQWTCALDNQQIQWLTVPFGRVDVRVVKDTTVLSSLRSGWTIGDATLAISGGAAMPACFASGDRVGLWFGAPSGVFADVPTNNWAEGYINAILNAGITTGYGGTNDFKPDLDVTRDQMAAFIIRAKEGEPAANYCDSGSPFSDVATSDWACRYIKRLFELGITTGYGPPGTYSSTALYRPELAVTRDRMAIFVIRAKEGEPAANYCDSGSPFSDVSPSASECKYIKRLFELGITVGYGGTTMYHPELTVTRAQAAAFIGRAFLGMQ